MLNMRAPVLRKEEEGYPDIEQTILIGLRTLAGQCDGARTWDGLGFNKPDSDFGKSLASQPYRLTPKQLSSAFFKLVKYQVQLLKADVTLPSVDEMRDYVLQRETEYAGEQAKKNAARVEGNKIAALPRTEIAGTIDYINGKLKVTFEYNREALEKMHAIQGKISSLRLKDATISPVRFEYAPEKAWWCPTQALKFLQESFPLFVLTDALQAEITRQENEARAAREAADALERAADERTHKALALLQNLEGVQGVLDGREIRLYQHQKDVIRRMVFRRRFINAHDMGMGKTLATLLAAKAIKLYEKKYSDKQVYVFVIGPVSTREDWLKSAGAVGVQIAYHTWGSVPKHPGVPYILIADEAQNAQNYMSQRTKKFLALAEDAEACFMLSGTPMKNGRPANLYPLLVAAQHPVAYPPDLRKSKFDKEYCAAQVTRWSKWDITGATNLSRLNQLLLHGKAACLEYKRKQDCLDLPPKERILKQVEISRDAQRVYERTVENLWERYESNVARRLAEYIEKTVEETKCQPGDVDTYSEENRIRQGEALVALGVLRHAGSVAKAETAIDEALEVIEQGDAPIIFTAFKDSAETIARALHAAVNDMSPALVAQMPLKDLDIKIISGDLIGKHRAVAIEEFQKSDAPAIVCLYGAGGVGVNLQRSANVILVDRPWTPGDAFQAEDRAWRIGQDRKVTTYWLQLPTALTPVDVKVDAVLHAKQKNIDNTLMGEEEIEGITFLGDKAESLLAEALGKKL